GSNNSRGNFQGSGRQPLPTNNDTPELRPVSASIAGDTNINGNIATGGIGSAAGMGNVSGGRMVAAVSKTPAATLDGFGFPSEKMRSDNFYKTPGKGASPSRARLVKVDPNCKGKNCQWKQLPANGDSSTVNCEGNPQCLLALTGPLSAKKKKQLNDYWKVQKTGRGVASSSSVATPDTAVEPNNPKYIKGTWWKGLDSIVRHKEIIDQCFQTDHAGDLQSNCDL
ncbi:hypothetical protein K2X05_14990, partial [bacterium]|nr:hypothetical protein [bacterium]